MGMKPQLGCGVETTIRKGLFNLSNKIQAVQVNFVSNFKRSSLKFFVIVCVHAWSETGGFLIHFYYKRRETTEFIVLLTFKSFLHTRLLGLVSKTNADFCCVAHLI